MDILRALTTPALNKESATPLYAQLEERILQLISIGALSSGDMLPAELDLERELHLSRATVRRCFEELVKNGHVKRVRGRGTFVSKNAGKGLVGAINFSDEIKALGKEPSSRVLGLRKVAASGMIARELEVKTGTLLWESRRVRMANKEPIQLDITMLPCSVCPSLTEEDLLGSIYQCIAEASGKYPAQRRESYEAIALDTQEAALLKQTKGAPAMRRLALTYDALGNPYEFCICIEPASVAELSVVLSGSSAQVTRRYL